MIRLLYADLEPEEVLLADQAYGSYVDLALVKQQFSPMGCSANTMPATLTSGAVANTTWVTIKSCGTNRKSALNT